MFVKIIGEIHYLWRDVDHEGEVLESFVTKKRNRKAALKFLKKAMKHYGRPKTIVTDHLRSYRAEMNAIGNAARQVTGRWLNNRAENSHQSFRRRERAMAKFRTAKSLQKFASIHSSVHNHFNQERHLYSREIFINNRTHCLVRVARSCRLTSIDCGFCKSDFFNLTTPPVLLRVCGLRKNFTNSRRFH